LRLCVRPETAQQMRRRAPLPWQSQEGCLHRLCMSAKLVTEPAVTKPTSSSQRSPGASEPKMSCKDSAVSKDMCPLPIGGLRERFNATMMRTKSVGIDPPATKRTGFADVMSWFSCASSPQCTCEKKSLGSKGSGSTAPAMAMSHMKTLLSPTNVHDESPPDA